MLDFLLQLLHVLKAVENMGLPEFIPQLKICIHNYSAPLELRLAALQAFRHMPCHRKVCISIDLQVSVSFALSKIFFSLFAKLILPTLVILPIPNHKLPAREGKF